MNPILRPIGVNICVKKDPKKPCCEGGILIPEPLERTPRFGPTVRGTVVGVGGKVVDVKLGDRVALKDVAGDDILIKGEYYTILREKDIVGIVLNDGKSQRVDNALWLEYEYNRLTHD